MSHSKESRNPSGSASYDDFSDRLRWEMREVVHGVGGGGAAGPCPAPRELGQDPSPRVDANGAWPRPSSYLRRAEPSTVMQGNSYKNDQPVPDRRGTSRSKSTLYHDSDRTETSRQTNQSSDYERSHGGEDYHKVLERQLAMQDAEIASLKRERLGDDSAMVTLEESVQQLEQRLEGKDAEMDALTHRHRSEMAELTHRLQITKETTQETLASEMNNIETEYERALIKADKDNAVLEQELADMRKARETRKDERRDAEQEHVALRKELVSMRAAMEKREDEQREERHLMELDTEKVQEEQQEELYLLKGQTQHQTEEIGMLKRQTHDQIEEIITLKRESHQLTEDLLLLKCQTQELKEEIDERDHHDRLRGEEIGTLKEAIEKSEGESHLLRSEIEQLQNENEECRNFRDTVEQEVQAREDAIKALEAECEEMELDMEREKVRLETAAADKRDHYKHLVEGLERANAELQHKLRGLTEESDVVKGQHDRAQDELKHEMRCLTEEFDVLKGQRNRDHKELEYELHCMTEERDVMKGRVVLLGETAEALEVALGEKQRVLLEKEEAVMESDKLWNDYQTLLSVKDSVQQALTAAHVEKGDYEDLLREHTVLQSEYEELRREHALLQSTRDVKVREHAVLESHYDALRREHTILENTKDSKLQLMDTVTRQRDKMRGEIEELKRKKGDLQKQRDALRQELICVLESTSEQRE